MKDKITLELKIIKESFTYLGVLRGVPLMDAMQESNEKCDQFVKSIEENWEIDEIPDEEEILKNLIDDYQELKKMTKAQTILHRIREAIRIFFEELIRLRDSGTGLEETMKMLIHI